MTPETKQRGRPLADSTPASGHIHLRVTMERKNRYVRAARRKKQKISEWMTETLDRESDAMTKQSAVWLLATILGTASQRRHWKMRSDYFTGWSDGSTSVAKHALRLLLRDIPQRDRRWIGQTFAKARRLQV